MSKFSADIARLGYGNPHAAQTIAREIAIEIRGIESDGALRPEQKSKRLTEFDADLEALAAHQAEVKSLADRYPFARALSGGIGNESLLVDQQPGTRPASPVAFDQRQLEAMYAAIKSRSSFAVSQKDFSTTSGVLLPEQAPGILGPIHEPRLIDKLPSIPVSAPAYEFVRHSSTTGGPGLVAEGGAKPESVAVIDTLTARVVKIATHAGISHETLRDFDAFLGYWQNELIAQIYDVEAAQILAGDGTGLNMTGLLHTSGILTHAITGGETALDALESSISTLRTGSAKATANLIVMNPADWSKIRRSKDSQSRYLVAPDPTSGEASTVWGVEVFTTTAQTAGTSIMLDTNKFGKVLVRDGITVQTGTSNDDFTKNIQRFVVEERLGLAVERPAAVLAVTGI